MLMATSRDDLSLYNADPAKFLRRYVTMDETWAHPVVKVDHETRRYSRLLKNRGARLLNMGLEKSQTH